jgi:ORF6N domain
MCNNAHYAHVGSYGVQAIALRQQVKRTIDRVPKDFMFQLHVEEV